MSPEEFQEKIVNKIDEICRLVVETIKDQIDRKYGCFELFGLDFLLDENLNPYLIEANVNPALSIETYVQKDLVPNVVRDTLYLVRELHPQNKDAVVTVPASNPK